MRELLFVLTFLLQETTRASQRKTTVLSCWGPGATLPSCRFREGQRLAAPETCSACAHTGSPSTGTSTTTRWGNKRAHVLYDHSVPGAGKPAGVEGLVLPVAPHCKSHDEVIGPPLQTQLVCVGFSRFQLEGFPYSFLFKTFKVFQESLKLEWKVWVCSSTVCPLSCRCVDVFFLFPPDICVHSSVRLSH